MDFLKLNVIRLGIMMAGCCHIEKALFFIT